MSWLSIAWTAIKGAAGVASGGVTTAVSGITWREVAAVALVIGCFYAGWRVEKLLEDREIAAQAAVIAQDKINAQAADLAATTAKIAADQRSQQIAADEIAAATKRASDLETILQDVQNAPASDDGIVAPVLRRTLDSLRQPGRTGPGNPAGQAVHPIKPPGVPAPPAYP